MKRSKSKDGSERLWFAPNKIEDIMSAELEKANLLPGIDNPVVNLESFVENYLKVRFDPYATLDSTILGVTEFRVGPKIKISINKVLTSAALDDDDDSMFGKVLQGQRPVGRYRATVAHEASHVILHKCLFDLSPDQGSLFDNDPGEPEVKHLQRCQKQNVLFRGSGGDWREIQANMGMAALLMPRQLFVLAFREEAGKLGTVNVVQNSSHANSIILQLSKRFQVSKQAAEIRLETLQLLAISGQATLLE